ncbi:ComEC/Rec2 family competence protein [Lysobacter niastensis]|uniref:Metallo-beta-lactamase domain-containing protein n=1 Tax=Lysobacter niastensis TaxID=380629 RepID=A0ABS0B8R4_9GAMM|nr:hypothetical protein [Lysobacter niastensis]MBF6024102.1 hypothetical protein [Lysobacter niastensis]
MDETDPDAELKAMMASGKYVVGRGITPRAAGTALARLPSAMAFAGPTANIYILSMGQADSMLVVGPAPARRTLLVDAGETNWNTRKGCLHVRDRIKEITGKHHVDYFLLTHYHQDHAGAPPITTNERSTEGGGLFCLLGGGPGFFTVGTLIDSGRPPQAFMPEASPSLRGIELLTDTWLAQGTLKRREDARGGSGQINLGNGMEVDIVVSNGRLTNAANPVHMAVASVNPGLYSAGRPASPNDFSIGMEITIGEFELFSAGDLSGAPPDDADADFQVTQNDQVYTNIEKALTNLWKASGRESRVEIYRASHHGSKNSSSQPLADLLAPQLVIYSCGGSHGHPDDSVLDRFQALGADQLITTKADRDDGTIDDSYGNGWINPAGEIQISVPLNGSRFVVETDSQAFSYPIHADTDE